MAGKPDFPLASYYLTQARVTHSILERDSKVAEAWRNHWDSFTLNTPNWQSYLRGAECPGKHPDRFLSRRAIIAYFERYVEHFHLPVRYNVNVESVELNRSRDGFVVEANAGRFAAKKRKWLQQACTNNPRFHSSVATSSAFVLNGPALGNPGLYPQNL